MAERKRGSNHLALVTGVALIVLALLTFFDWNPPLEPREPHKLIDGGASVLFGAVLLVWRFSEDETWGVGFESVTMIVGVVTAVIAIFALVPIRS